MFKIFNKKKFKTNLSWLIFDKIFRASLNVLLFIFLARNLGPSEFGILSYLLAIIFLFTSISSLGINPILTNKIIKNKKELNNHKMIINSYYLRFLFSIMSYLAFILIIIVLDNDKNILNYSIIIGLLIILKSSEILFSYFEAKLLSKFIVISQLLGLIVSFSIIIFVITNNLNLKYIYYALVIDILIVFIFINSLYYLKEKKFFVSLDFLFLKKIINQSFPVLISAMGIILYMRIDQIMIKSLLDEYNLGMYSASVRFIEIFHFIPKIIIISFLPILLLSKTYNFKLLKLNSTLFKLSFFISILIFYLSDTLITSIYGHTYSNSIMTTKILSFSLIFVAFGVINEHWYINKGLQKYYAFYVLSGALINITLNFFLIKKFGIEGAAYSTLITYFLIIFIFDLLNKKTAALFKIKYKSLFFL